MTKHFILTPARATWVASTFVGRIVFRRQIAAARRRAMTVIGAATVGSILALSLFAAFEELRED